MAEKKRGRGLLIILVILAVIVTAGIVFYYTVFPKLAVSYLRSDRAPDFVKTINREIEANSGLINRTLNQYGISKQQAAGIIDSVEYDDIEYIQRELGQEGYRDKGRCAEILLSRIDDPEIDKDELKQAIVQNISLKDLEQGIGELYSLNPTAVKAALPVMKEYAKQTLASDGLE